MTITQWLGGVSAGAPGLVQSPGRRLGFAVIVMALLFGLTAPAFTDRVDRTAPKAAAGVVDYTRWGGLRDPVELSGEWLLAWRGPGGAAGAAVPMAVPGRWSGPRAGGAPLPEHGAVSYELTIRGLQAGRYVLHVPTLFAATRVMVGGRVMSEAGVAGPTAATSRTEVRSHDIAFEATGADLPVRIDVSAFQHRDNGLENAPVLGPASAMSHWITLDWMRSLLLIASLLLLSCYGVVVFLFRPQDRASIYFALSLLFLLPLVAVFSHDNLLLATFPTMSFRLMLNIQYLCGVVALGLFFSYANALFPRESPRLLFRIAIGAQAAVFLAHLAVGVTGDTLALSQLSQMLLPVRTATLLYMVGIVIAAVVRRRDGAVVFLFGIGLFAVSLTYSDLVTNSVIPRLIGVDVMPVATLLLLFSHLVILAERWSLSIAAAERTNEELRRLLDVNISITSEIQLEVLLTKIVTATTKIIHADRTSLFLHDENTDQLWSVVAEGVETREIREIRFPAAQGLAGWCFTHREPVNVANAYADQRFNRGVDAATGYRTGSVLAVPVTARDGRCLGVMQALNSRKSEAFTDEDVARMSAFAAQAAIAIDNATLFAEVASQRNYNDSILRSMSNGVITLDREARLVKLNAAACAILGVEPEVSGAPETQQLIVQNNPRLVEEIAAIRESGQPKTLLDADLVTVRGDTISANVSIVPLMGDEGQAGLLIIVEDITAGKRMQGAMRRFMTQKVVDQVLGREDELLFGTACRASVLFADIRNFTTLAETLQPRETVDMLNEIFTELFEAVAASDGVLDKFIGDAIMAVYGAPLSSGRDPENAVESAVQMLRMVDLLNRGRRDGGRPDLRIGIGVASGDVVAGTIGSPKRMDYTVIGDSVNLASRLQAITKVYEVGIVVCEATAAAIAGAQPLRELDIIRVRGRRRPARIFEVLTQPDQIGSAGLAAYRQGREGLANRKWAGAVAAFETAVALDPADRPAALMLHRARILQRRPPAADWDGVWDSASAT